MEEARIGTLNVFTMLEGAKGEMVEIWMKKTMTRVVAIQGTNVKQNAKETRK